MSVAQAGRHPAPAWATRWATLLHTLAPVRDASQQARWLEALAAAPGPAVLAFANAHALNLAARDEDFFRHLAAADHLARDGQGMAWLMRLQGRDPGLNLNGTDLIPQLLQRQAGRRIALLGTREPWLSRAAQAVRRLAPGCDCLAVDGFQPLATYLRAVERQSPSLVVLGMGMPRQELVAQALRASLRPDAPCLIVCGGAILDFLAGRVPRAPRALRRLGLEWAWRLAREPRRLFARYVIGNPLFLARALRLSRQMP